MEAAPVITPDFKLRTSVSLGAKYVIAWELAKARLPDENIGTFSDFLSDAIKAYAAKHHPALLADADAAIRKDASLVTSHKFYNAKNPTGKKLRSFVELSGEKHDSFVEGRSEQDKHQPVRRREPRRKAR